MKINARDNVAVLARPFEFNPGLIQTTRVKVSANSVAFSLFVFQENGGPFGGEGRSSHGATRNGMGTLVTREIQYQLLGVR